MRVVVVDFDMPISSMVVVMLKWAIASIPAGLIIWGVAVLVWVIFTAILRGPTP
jgi:hypothetical protein